MVQLHVTGKDFFYQCELHRENESTTSWLPEKFCKASIFLSLFDNGKWSNDWKVIHVYGPRITIDQAREQSHYYATHRKGSDI